jgi:hypothetical protein
MQGPVEKSLTTAGDQILVIQPIVRHSTDSAAQVQIQEKTTQEKFEHTSVSQVEFQTDDPSFCAAKNSMHFKSQGQYNW